LEVGEAMSKTQGGDTPGGYGHDKRSENSGIAKNDGRVHVVHEKSAPKSAEPIKFFLDGQGVEAQPGETIFRAARRYNVKLPHLCYTPKPGYRPDGNCRVCMVEVEGERVLAASCIRTPTPGMKVNTQTDRAKASRNMVL
jgi:formate dehydrogenase major subunit